MQDPAALHLGEEGQLRSFPQLSLKIGLIGGAPYSGEKSSCPVVVGSLPQGLPEEYCRLAAFDIANVLELEATVVRAWLLLHEKDQSRVRAWCDQIIPLFGIPDVSETSFSSPDVPRTIFVSPKGDLSMLEALVHESAHLELFEFELILQRLELWDYKKRADFADSIYSPWRNESRPAIGVLHGAYVFARIESALGRSLGKSAQDRCIEIRREIISCLDDLRRSFRTTPFSDLIIEIEQQVSTENC